MAELDRLVGWGSFLSQAPLFDTTAWPVRSEAGALPGPVIVIDEIDALELPINQEVTGYMLIVQKKFHRAYK